MDAIDQNFRAIVAKRLRELRRITFPGKGGASRCATAFGVVLQQWSRWETGRASPKKPTLHRLAEFFNIPVEELFRDSATGRIAPAPHAMDARASGKGIRRHPPRGREPHRGKPPGAPGRSGISPLPTATLGKLAERLIASVTAEGLTVKLDREAVAYLVELFTGESGKNP